MFMAVIKKAHTICTYFSLNLFPYSGKTGTPVMQFDTELLAAVKPLSSFGESISNTQESD